jgi:hypothetical protein
MFLCQAVSSQIPHFWNSEFCEQWQSYLLFLCRVDKVAKRIISLRPYVPPNRATRPPLNRFSRNLIIYEDFSRICRENSSFMKMEQNNWSFSLRPTYLFDHISLSSSWNEKYIRKLHRETRKTHFTFSAFCFENRAAFEIIWNNIVIMDTHKTTDDNMAHSHCMLDT